MPLEILTKDPLEEANFQNFLPVFLSPNCHLTFQLVKLLFAKTYTGSLSEFWKGPASSKSPFSKWDLNWSLVKVKKPRDLC